jgi:membrane-bound lytic murein transglycosylase
LINIRFLTTTTALALLSACAASPPTPAPAAPATVIAAVPAASATPTAAATASNGPDEHTKYLAKKAKELDYQIEKRNGQVFYCQTSAQLGTRFQTKGCLNEADFEDVVRRSAELQTIMHQPGSCSGTACVHN